MKDRAEITAALELLANAASSDFSRFSCKTDGPPVVVIVARGEQPTAMASLGFGVWVLQVSGNADPLERAIASLPPEYQGPARAKLQLEGFVLPPPRLALVRDEGSLS